MSIKVTGLTKSFDNKKVLDNISFEVNDGETLAIVDIYALIIAVCFISFLICCGQHLI